MSNNRVYNALRFAGKMLLRLTAACFIIITLVIIVTFVLAKYDDMEGRKFANGRSLGVALDRMNMATVNIWLESVFRGRAYLNASEKYLMTNLHVMNAICDGPHYKKNKPAKLSCQQIAVTLRQTSTRAEPMRALLRVKKCSEWLDACVLDIDLESQEIKDAEESPAKDINENTLVILPRNEDRHGSTETVIIGDVTKSGSVFVHSSLSSRPGYSGSPVFNPAGDFVGILRSAYSGFYLNLTGILNFIGMRSSGMMRRRSIFITKDSLQSVLLCQSVGPTDCNLVDLKTLTKYISGALLTEKLDLRTKLEIFQAMELFGQSFARNIEDIRKDSAILREMLTIAAASEEEIINALTMNGWIRDVDKLQEFATLLIMMAVLDDQYANRMSSILNRIKMSAATDSQYISALISTRDSFFWGAYFGSEARKQGF